MIATVLAVLDKTEFKAIWEDQLPVVFTRKARTLREGNAKALRRTDRHPLGGGTAGSAGLKIRVR